jgi:hypothetical protein
MGMGSFCAPDALSVGLAERLPRLEEVETFTGP